MRDVHNLKLIIYSFFLKITFDSGSPKREDNFGGLNGMERKREIQEVPQGGGKKTTYHPLKHRELSHVLNFCQMSTMLLDFTSVIALRDSRDFVVFLITGCLIFYAEKGRLNPCSFQIKQVN